MEKNQKLGRGFEEISHYFLSNTSKKVIEQGSPPRRKNDLISIYYPASDKIKSFFLSNLALEFAKNQSPVHIWDWCYAKKISIKTIMERFIKNKDETQKLSVQLYGLPSINIYEVTKDDDSSINFLVNADNNNRSFILINTENSLEYILKQDILSDSIILTKIDKISLLRSYAFIKLILEKAKDNKIYLVLDDVKDVKKAEVIFSKFAEYIFNKFNHNLDYLGPLCHDEHFAQSLDENELLVLKDEVSSSKDNLIEIAKNLLSLIDSKSNSKNVFNT